MGGGYVWCVLLAHQRRGEVKHGATKGDRETEDTILTHTSDAVLVTLRVVDVTGLVAGEGGGDSERG